MKGWAWHARQRTPSGSKFINFAGVGCWTKTPLSTRMIDFTRLELNILHLFCRPNLPSNQVFFNHMVLQEVLIGSANSCSFSQHLKLILHFPHSELRVFNQQYMRTSCLFSSGKQILWFVCFCLTPLHHFSQHQCDNVFAGPIRFFFWFSFFFLLCVTATGLFLAHADFWQAHNVAHMTK